MKTEAVILQTGRLILRDYVLDDWEAVFAYQSDPRYLRYYPRSRMLELESRSFVERNVYWQHERPRTRFQMAVILKDNGQLIGSCGIRKETVDDIEAELGYEIAPDYWERAYATEAAREMVRFGFEEMGLHRIWGWCIADNEGSVRVMEKLGMQREGRLRESRWMKGRWWDRLLYGILEDEWRAWNGT
jgi:ribosomal-protein-alanine N-acetyltransferase